MVPHDVTHTHTHTHTPSQQRQSWRLSPAAGWLPLHCQAEQPCGEVCNHACRPCWHFHHSPASISDTLHGHSQVPGERSGGRRRGEKGRERRGEEGGVEVGVSVVSKHTWSRLMYISNEIIASCHHSNKDLVCVAFGWLATSGKMLHHCISNYLPLGINIPKFLTDYCPGRQREWATLCIGVRPSESTTFVFTFCAQK